MALVNTYGLQITGLRKASNRTRRLENYTFKGFYVLLYYSFILGEVQAVEKYEPSQRICEGEDTETTLYVGYATKWLTMQQIADMVASRVKQYMQSRA